MMKADSLKLLGPRRGIAVVAAVAVLIAGGIALGQDGTEGPNVVQPEQANQGVHVPLTEQDPADDPLPAPLAPPNEHRVLGPDVNPDNPPAEGSTPVPDPQGPVDGIEAEVNTADARPPADVIAFTVLFQGQYEYGGVEYTVGVMEPTQAALDKQMLLGADTVTVTDASGDPQQAFEGPGDSTSFVSGKDIVVVRGGDSDGRKAVIANLTFK
jgi:hypothetical protein